MKILTGSMHSPNVLKRLGLEAFLGETSSVSETQRQTSDTFSYKWSRRDTYESDHFKNRSRKWMLEKYCGNDPEIMESWFAGGRKLIIDAGCGSGFSSLLFFGDYLKHNDYVGVDISNAIDVASTRFDEAGIHSYVFLQSSILDLPLAPGSCDIIISEGVLHHTDDTRTSMLHLVKALAPGGRLMFYVYKKKSVVREFTDDHIREAIQDLDDEAAWEALKPLTNLGRTLGQMQTTITVPEDIDFLGISAGEYNLQRFFYWHFMKMFYDPDLDFETMNHINFDWFRPLNCHRHTPDEVNNWCTTAGLEIERFVVEEAGITVVARQPE